MYLEKRQITSLQITPYRSSSKVDTETLPDKTGSNALKTPTFGFAKGK